MYWNKLKATLALVALLALAACKSSNLNDLDIKVISPEDFTPIQKALSKEFFDKGFSKKEIKQLDRFATTNDYGVKIYLFKNRRLSKKKKLYCHIAFMLKKGTNRQRASATAYEGMSVNECQLLVLRSVRPSAYRRILSDKTLVTERMKKNLQSW